MESRPAVTSRRVVGWIGLLCSLPAFYFVTGMVLKHELGLVPTAQIYVFSPIVLVGGLALALGLSRPLVLRLKLEKGDRAVTLSATLLRRPWNLLVVGGSGLFLAVLVGYVIVENLLESLS